jgi:tetratricopeptide (TPR) repeat protein/tRNA A-37 threonylcarbamoyl transferase component Bud32
MPATDWNKVKEIVADALEVVPGERAALIERLCAGDVGLKTEVIALVEASDDSEGVIDPRTDAWLGLGGPDVLGMRGQRIGRYELQDLIAEGAMAAVYRARQRGLDRVVALKMFRTSLPLVDAKRRFQREAQALAKLRHPNIASIFEAGSHQTSDHRAMPYIAMEYVDGGTLTQYVLEKNVNRRGCIELMIKVASAVHAAHQQAIIHCDLKPPNVLVDRASGEPKVLDFGIARFVSDDNSTWQTTAGVLLGTPGYMSPEQASGTQRDVDVRSDVYALGVMLFELLTGTQPIDLRGLTIQETLRRIDASETARASSIDPTLAGDLDMICATALQKDKSLRYASAEAFAEDLRRYLNNEPIAARDPSTWYVMGKFARRNRGKLAIATALVGVLIGAVIVSTWGFINADRQRRIAEDQRGVAEHQKALALDANKQALAVNDFMKSMLQTPNPEVGTRDMSILQAMRFMEPKIAERFAETPIAEAEVRYTLGTTFLALDQNVDALKQAELATALYRKVAGETDDKTLYSVVLLGESLRWNDRPADARAALEPAIERARKERGDDIVPMEALLASLGGTYSDEGNVDAAEPILKDVLARREKRLGPDDSNTLSTLSNLTLLQYQRNKIPEAVAGYRELLRRMDRKLGKDSSQRITPLFNLADSLFYAHEFEECIQLASEAREQAVRTFGPSSEIVMKASRSMCSAYVELGDYENALIEAHRAVEVAKGFLPPNHYYIYTARGAVVRSLLYLKRYDEARREIESLRADLPLLDAKRRDAIDIVTQSILGVLLCETGEVDRGVAQAREALARGEASDGISIPPRMSLKRNLGRCLLRAGKLDEAEAQLVPAWEATHEEYMPRDRANAADLLAELAEKRGKADDASTWRARAASVVARPTTRPATQPSPDR